MNYSKKYSNGFSLVEILTATVVLTIVAGATYATFLAIIRLTVTSKDELEAHSEASRWLEEVMTTRDISSREDATNNWARSGSFTPEFPDEADVNLNAASSILQEDYSTWPLATKSSVSNLAATYSLQERNLGSTMARGFKRIRVNVSWDETP